MNFKDNIDKLDIKKIYTEKDGLYYFPFSAIDHIMKNFNNCILEISDRCGKEKQWVIHPDIKCLRNELSWKLSYNNMTLLHDGKLIKPESMCDHCKHMLKSYVGECYGNEFEPADRNWQFRKNGDNIFTKIKPGYTHEYDFDGEIKFDRETITRRIYEYERKGKWLKCAKQIKCDFCENCFKYRTSSCKKGFSAGMNPLRCSKTREEILQTTKMAIVREYGSMQKFLTMLNQCGRRIIYMDKYTKRASKRVISVPAMKDGKKGFYMGWRRYPFEIEARNWRNWEPENKKVKKHETFISLYDLKKEYGLPKTKYRKAYDEKLCCAYLFLKKTDYPGSSLSILGHRNYLVSISAKGNEDYIRLVSETGNSKNTYEVEYGSLRELADAVYVR